MQAYTFEILVLSVSTKLIICSTTAQKEMFLPHYGYSILLVTLQIILDVLLSVIVGKYKMLSFGKTLHLAAPVATLK